MSPMIWTRLWQRLRRHGLWLALLTLVWLLCSGQAQAGPLADRLQAFPHWQQQPPTQAPQGDLFYPAWIGGTWHLTTTLVELAAPLAPDLVTPGFAGNEALLHQPIDCQVRFIPAPTQNLGALFPGIMGWGGLPLVGARVGGMRRSTVGTVISDRPFNSKNLATAYLGPGVVQAVKIDPQNPNRQVTLLRGDRQLESTVTGRAVETPDRDTFITTELFQQVFRGTAQPYFNQVENTTAYRRSPSTPTPGFEADQITAIYLSPQDPDYFQARETPVALYRYHLVFTPE